MTREPECIGWKCWRCKIVLELGQECDDCQTELGEYYGDIASLMVYEHVPNKVEQVKQKIKEV